MEHFIQYNDDGTVNVPFGRVAEWYIENHSILKGFRLKCQSRKRTPDLIKEGIITISRVEGAADFIEWKTKKGETKTTNRIDDSIKLTPHGEEYLQQIERGEKKDRLCWSWVMFCAGDGDTCQRECGGIGNCKEECSNFTLSNNIKNYLDMHLCKVKVISESKLSWLKTDYPLKIKVVNTHLPQSYISAPIPNTSKLNLSRQTRDNIIVNRRADHKTAKEVKAKLLAPYNNANEEELKDALKNQRVICNDKKLRSFIMRDDRRIKENAGPWTILHYMVFDLLKPQGFVLYYQQPDLSKSENSIDHYYQLTLSHDLWLKNGKNFGQFCIGIDGKYDLNNDKAPVLTFVVENNIGIGTPLAFGLY